MGPMDNVTNLVPGNGRLLIGLLELSGWDVRFERCGAPAAVARREGVEIRVAGEREADLPMALFQKAMRSGSREAA
jgi:hypothetical protein